MKKRNKFLIVATIFGSIIFLSALILFSPLGYYLGRFIVRQQYKEDLSGLNKSATTLIQYKIQNDFKVLTRDEGASHFIKLNITLGFEPGQPELQAEIESRNEVFKNIVNLILSRKKVAELSKISEQLDLREEIKESLNHMLQKGKISEVYFNEFVIQ